MNMAIDSTTLEYQRSHPMDLVFLLTHQTHAFRMVEFFNLRDTLSVFPEDFAEQAVEVGPHTNHDGPMLTLFKSVHISPAHFMSWFEGSYVRRQVHRVFCLQQNVPTANSRDELVTAIISAGPPAGYTGIRMYTAPKSLEVNIGNDLVPHGFVLHPKDFSHVLVIVKLGGCYRWSYTPESWLYRQACDETKRFDDSVAKAVNKIDECFSLLGLTHQQLGWALDLGAAPGAWSMYLSGHAKGVIAVDPAELHVDALAPGVVHHVQDKAEDASEAIQALLQGQQLDVLVCDMNQHPVRVARIVKPLLQHLKPGGVLIMTLKFFGYGRDRSHAVNKLQAYYGAELEPGMCLWLLANTKCERTFIARKAGSMNLQSCAGTTCTRISAEAALPQSQ
eukprot:jgi/Chrzof1/1754/Cz10g19220.t1